MEVIAINFCLGAYFLIFAIYNLELALNHDKRYELFTYGVAILSVLCSLLFFYLSISGIVQKLDLILLKLNGLN
jgi:heme/copper-type cytochrome/quinol oxidase subunit 1